VMDLVEHEFEEVRQIDKIFSSCWYKSSMVVAGTKDNKLICWKLGNKKSFEVIPLLDSGKNISPDSCGIHSVSINPSNSLLVTGATDPSELGIYDMPSFFPKHILTGHSNWSFSCAFLNDNCVISGSKDKTICLWKLNENQDRFILTPYVQKAIHQDKIRDLKVLPNLKSIATLSSDRTIKVWDQHTFGLTTTINLDGMSELVCLAYDNTSGVIAVGSKYLTSLFDIRSNTLIQSVSIQDGRIRSLNFSGNYISIGGGGGYFSFYNIRKMEYSKVNSNKEDPVFYYMTGKGWKETNTYGGHAIFTHNFDPEEKMLFVAGGPISSSCSGCYAAVWSKTKVK